MAAPCRVPQFLVIPGHAKSPGPSAQPPYARIRLVAWVRSDRCMLLLPARRAVATWALPDAHGSHCFKHVVHTAV
jgi:hypothetical protein